MAWVLSGTLQHDIGEHAYDEFVATCRQHESVQVLMVRILLTTVTAIKDLMHVAVHVVNVIQAKQIQGLPIL